jgi:hypothetical protein
MSNGQKDIRKSGYQEEGYQEIRVSESRGWNSVFYKFCFQSKLYRKLSPSAPKLNPPYEAADKNSSATESTEKITTNEHEWTQIF